MARSVRLRRWQKQALDRLGATDSTDFLAVATPGAGKTTFALTAALQHLATHADHHVVVVAPTSHLKVQWASAAAQLGLELEPRWSSAHRRFPADMHGVVVTYQQVAANPEALRAHVGRAFVILDELHHAGDEAAWGNAVRHAFEPAARRLALSGTPFRSDTAAIPFVHYRLDEAVPDYEYGYGEALADRGVVRPVYFPRVNGFMEWTAPDGAYNAASFDDALDAARSSQRLRTALSLEGEWLPTVLGRAHRQLVELRRDQPDAAGLIIAADQDHARGIADLLERRFGVHATLALSDDPRASQHIERFAAATTPWIVAVRMVSEGVDIPRLRIGVFATTTSTELFFRQAVGRLVRWTGHRRREKAFLFIPDDRRLRTFAHQIAEQRRHNLRKPSDDAATDAFPGPDPTALDGLDGPDEEQLSLFTALSAVAIDTDQPELSVFDDAVDADVDLTPDATDDADLSLEFEPPPLPGGGHVSDAVSRREHKAHLRSRNTQLAKDLARFTGMTHAQVNGQLNRLAGVERIREATAEQLERRLHHAQRWFDRL